MANEKNPQKKRGVVVNALACTVLACAPALGRNSMLGSTSITSSLRSNAVRQSLASSVHVRAASAGAATVAVYRHISEGLCELALGLLCAVHIPHHVLVYLCELISEVAPCMSKYSVVWALE